MIPRPHLLLLLFLALVGSAGLAACGNRSEPTNAPATQPLRLVLDYLPNADHAGIYTAQATGEFRKAGLDVRITTPSDPAAPLKLVASGRADLAISYEPEVFLARAKGIRILSVAAIANRPLTSLMTVGGRPVDPKGFAGKRIGTAGIPYQSAYLKQILSDAGVDPGSVTEVNVGFNLIPAMLSKKVDATLGAFWNIEGVELRMAHRRPRIVPVDKAGVPLYDELVLIASETTARRRGALIRRFIQALQRGTRAAERDPSLAVRALRDAAPDIKQDVAERTVAATLPVLVPARAKDPFGWQDPVAWQAYGDWMARNGLIPQAPAAGAVLTNEFLPGEGVGQAGEEPAAP